MESFYNTVKNNAFTFRIEKIPQTNFRVVAVNLPSLEVPPPEDGYPAGAQFFPGSAPNFSELSIRFIVDENMLTYEEIFNWITMQRFAQTGKVKEQDLVSDGFLTVLTNEGNPNVYFYFKDLFPMSISELNFDSATSNPENIECMVTFRFAYFLIRRAVKQEEITP